MLLPLLLAFGISETFICFYDKSDNRCLPSYTAYSLDEFDQFRQKQFTDNEYTFLFATSMISECTIDFSNISPDEISVSLMSLDLGNHDIVYLDFSQKKTFNSLSILNVEIISASQNINSKFSNIIMTSSKIRNLESLTVDHLTVDTDGLSSFKEIITNSFNLQVSTILSQTHHFVKLSSKSPENAVAVFNFMGAKTISVIDSIIAIDDLNIQFEQTNFKDISFLLNLTLIDTSFQAVSRSSQNNFPPFNFVIGSKSNLHFVNSNFPVFDSSNSRVYGSISGSGTVEFENEYAPFSINSQQITLKLLTQKMSLLGPLFIRKSVKVTSESEKAELYISNAIITNTSNSAFTTNGDITVHIDQLESLFNNTNCNFTGSQATYAVSRFPSTEIFSLHFSNLLITSEAKYTLNYLLGQSSFLSADSVRGSDTLNVVANFISSLPTESEVKDHLNEELDLVKLNAESEVNIKVTFPRYNVKGFDSATNIYSVHLTSPTVSIVLDHELGEFNNYLCIKGANECPDGSLVFENSKEFGANWTNFLRETAEDIYFYFRTPYPAILDFTPFIANDNHPRVYFESTMLVLDQRFVQGELGPIVVNGTGIGTQIVIQRKTSPVMLISPLEFYSTSIAAHSIETINCTLLPYLKIDPISLAKYPQKCAANYLVLDKFDDYTEFDFRPSSVVLSSDDPNVSDVTVQIFDQNRPYVNLTTSTKSVTFSSSESEEENKKGEVKYHSVFSRFEMTSPGQEINSNLSTDSFDGYINVHNFDGSLNVISADGKVPLKFTDTKSLTIKSEVNVKELDYLSINGNVDLTKSDVSTTFYDVHFGPDFQVESGEKGQFRINKGFFDSRTKQAQEEINGQLILEDSGSLYVNSSTTVRSKSFKIDSGNKNQEATITIGYRLSEVPYINFGSFEATVNPTVIFEYDESDRYGGYDESSFSEDFSHFFNSVSEVPVVCGSGLKCSSWEVQFKSSIPQFNGKTSILDAVCNETDERECLSIRFVPHPMPTEIPSRTSKPYSPTTKPHTPTEEPHTPTPTSSGGSDQHKRKIALIVGISVGATAAISILIIAIFCCVRRRNPSLNDQHLLETKEQNYN